MSNSDHDSEFCVCNMYVCMYVSRVVQCLMSRIHLKDKIFHD